VGLDYWQANSAIIGAVPGVSPDEFDHAGAELAIFSGNKPATSEVSTEFIVRFLAVRKLLMKEQREAAPGFTHRTVRRYS
jgi:hypothetical protein